MQQGGVADGNTIEVTVRLEDAAVRPTWTVDVSSTVDGVVIGKNELEEIVALDLAEGTAVVRILNGWIEGVVENWRECGPGERSARQLKNDMDDRAYWVTRTAREAERHWSFRW